MSGLVVGAIALALLVPSSSQSQAAALESFDGAWVLASDRRELRSMDQAIDRVVDQLNLFIREIARGEIHRRIAPERRIELDVIDDQTLALSFDEWGPVRVPVDGRPQRARNASGEDVRLTVRFRDGRLVQHSATPRGARTNVFALSADAQRLSMRVRITSGQLPADIRYRLTYRRAR